MDTLYLRILISKASYSGKLTVDLVKYFLSIKPSLAGECFALACEDGNIKIAKFLIAECSISKCYLTLGFQNACRNGSNESIKIVRAMLTKKMHGKVDYNLGFYSACFSDRFEIIELLLASLVGKGLINYRIAIPYACESGSVSLVKFLFKQIEKEYRRTYITSACFLCACISGNKEIVDFLEDLLRKEYLENEEDLFVLDKDLVNDGLAGACMSGNKELIDLMLQKGADDFEYAIEHACFRNMEIVKMLCDKKEEKKFVFTNVCLFNACESGNLEIVKNILENKEFSRKEFSRKEFSRTDYLIGLEYACKGGKEVIVGKKLLSTGSELDYLEIAKLMILLGAKDEEIGYANCLDIACVYKNIEIVKYLIGLMGLGSDRCLDSDRGKLMSVIKGWIRD